MVLEGCFEVDSFVAMGHWGNCEGGGVEKELLLLELATSL